VLSRLVSQWTSDANYSHGFLMIPFAAYLSWQRRAHIAAADSTPSQRQVDTIHSPQNCLPGAGWQRQRALADDRRIRRRARSRLTKELP